MGRAFDRVVIIMMENSAQSTVLKNSYMDALRSKGVFLQNATGATHPSQPNYINMICGDTMNVINDGSTYAGWWPYVQPEERAYAVTSVIDLLENKNLTWKAYAEDILPENIGNFPIKEIPDDVFPFARKHVPMLSLRTVTEVPERLACIVNADQFETDLKAGTLPDYSWYVPNLNNDGHTPTPEQKAKADEIAKTDPKGAIEFLVNSLTDNVAAFLHGFLGDDPLARFPPKTLLIITYDEAAPYDDDYHIYTLLLGDMLEAGTIRTEPYDHFSLLRSVEENFDLGTLGRNDTYATPYWFLM